MGKDTRIEWATHTFNPWTGCQAVSPACDHCYAAAWAKRAGRDFAVRQRTTNAYWKQPLKWNREAERAFKAWNKFKATQPGLTDAQLEAQGFVKPRRPRVFCSSLADVFDNAVPEQWRADLFELIRATPHLDWLLLTKRIGNAEKMLDDACRALHDNVTLGWSNNPLKTGPRLDNIWIGATVCNQAEADRDIAKLLAVPAAKRFLSVEPMLGPVDLRLMRAAPLWAGDGPGMPFAASDRLGLDWVIAGGESGPHARPMHPDWVRSLRDQCVAAGVPFFFKRWGEWSPNCFCATKKAHRTTPLPEPGYPGCMFRCGKKAAAGRLLDDREWNEVPS